MKYTDVKLGDKLKVIGQTRVTPWTCLKVGDVLEVKQDPDGGALYVDCGEGEHYLTYDVDPHKQLHNFERV